MRARDYAREYRKKISSGTHEDLAEIEILTAMVRETREYHIRIGNTTGYAFLDDLDNKWRAFCKIVQKEDHSDTVHKFLEAFDPTVYGAWMSWKRILKFDRDSGRN